MKRKRYVVIVFLILICSVFLLVSCGEKGGNTVSPITPKEWTEYINEMSAFLTKTVTDVNFKKEYYYDYSFNVGFVFDDEEKKEYEWYYTLRIFGNIGDEGVGDGVIKIVDNKNHSNLLHIFFDNESCWIEFADKKILYENFNINSAAIRYLGDGLTFADELYLNSVINSIARLAFYDGYANKEKTEYVFKFDFKGIFETDGFRNIFNSLPTELIKQIYQYVNVDNFDDFLVNMPNFNGEIRYSIEDNKVVNIKIDGADFSSPKDVGKINFDMGNMIVKNGKLEGVADEKPKSDVGFIVSTFGEFQKEGKITFGTDEKTVAEYNYTVNSNIDLMKLIANGFDFNKLDDDNYFHLKISHKCSDKCGEYCKIKYMVSQGSVLDIAFSPKYFDGSKKLYISFNIKSLLNNEAMSYIGNSSFINGIKLIADYKLLTLETAYFNNFLGDIGSFAVSDLFDFIGLILSSADYYSDNDIPVVTINYLDVFEKLGFDDSIIGVIRATFSDGTDYSTKMTISISDHIEDEYDIYNSAIHIIDKYVPELKSYSAFLDNADPAINWEFDDYIYDRDTKVYNIYYSDGSKMYECEMPISERELDRLIGAKIRYSYDDIHFNKNGVSDNDVKYAEILEILSKDIKDAGDYSTVTVKVKYPSQWMGSVISLLGYLKFLDEYIYDVVELKIKLDTITDIKVDRERDSYYYGEKVGNEIYEGVANINYVRGSKKVNVVGTCSTLGDMLSAGKHIITYELLGEKILKEVTVLGKNENISYEVDFSFREGTRTTKDANGIWHYSGEISTNILSTSSFNYMRLKITHPNNSVSIRNIPTSEMYYLSGDNVKHYYDSDYTGVWRLDSSNRISFLRSGRYEVRTNAFGLINEMYFVFDISEKRPTIDQSRYGLSDSTSYNSIYFDNHTYTFRFKVRNTYHGVVGLGRQELKIATELGYTNDYGSLSYIEVNNDEYIMIESIDISGLEYNVEGGKYFMDLPPSIRNDITITVRVKFLKRGYYQLRAMVGTASVRTNQLKVEETILKPVNQ